MRDDRGLTLLELLIGAALGILVMLGAASFYLSTLRFSADTSSQTFLQRQGSLIVEEMARQIRPATAVTRGACNSDPQSLGATNSLGSYCFYSSASKLWETLPGPLTFDLFSGSPVALTVTGFTTTLSGKQATVSFQLRDTKENSMTFRTTFYARN